MNRLVESPTIGPEAAGIRMSAEEFDIADFERGCRYELIQGVLVVSPAPLPEERDPNEELGRWLRNYQEFHPLGSHLERTLPEHDVCVDSDRRRADRVVWAGLGRRPQRNEAPTIAVEFVSEGKRNAARDYEDKRRDYAAIGIREYWVIDRFRRTLTVFYLDGREQTLGDTETYTTPILPGFEMPLEKLFAAAEYWADA